MAEKKWILIGRTHIKGSSWKRLRRYLNAKITPIEPAKAMIFTKQSRGILKRKLQIYNKKYGTDFFI